MINQITVVSIYSINKQNKNIGREITSLVIENKTPKELISNTFIKDSINFAGRNIALSNNSCYLRGVNKIQCLYFGEMNWSTHKELKSAQLAIDVQFEIRKSRKMITVISEEMIEIEFEGIPILEKKLI